MPDKKQDSPFTVTDRRPFTAEGELRKETSEEEAPQAQPAVAPKQPARAEEAPIPQAPSAAEQQEQADAYRMLQLGLMREEGSQPHIDLIGARQTIDTISLLSEKTKGNLTAAEENFLQNSLYELRMAYVEVTNALARPPQATGTDSAKR